MAFVLTVALANPAVAGCATRVGSLETRATPCAGGACAAPQTCCLLDQRCYDPLTQPGACGVATQLGDGAVAVLDAATAPDSGAPSSSTDAGAGLCTSNSQCAPDEFCGQDPTLYGGVQYCLGVGRCTSRVNTPLCGSPERPSSSAPPGCAICGCDGVTYPSIQDAFAAGARTSVLGPCGVGLDLRGDGGRPAPRLEIGCAIDAQCPASQRCCALYGRCYDPVACPTCCALPPRGARAPCMTDAQCTPEYEYCQHDGCNGPGGCARRRANSECGGAITPVCGCDGRSYTNDCYASAAGTNVASRGMCP